MFCTVARMISQRYICSRATFVQELFDNSLKAAKASVVFCGITHRLPILVFLVEYICAPLNPMFLADVFKGGGATDVKSP